MEFDGKKQRNALTAAENALRALADGNTSRAAANASRATDLDQIGAYRGLADAITAIAASSEGAPPTDTQWDDVAATLDPGPLAFLVEELRG